MNAGADVASLAALTEWYAALVGFRTDAQNALSSLNLSLQQAANWLDDQERYWHRQVRVCEDEVTQAKAELRTRQFANLSGEKPDCTVQEDNLRRAKSRLENAEDRKDAVPQWMKRLPKEILDTYDGPVRHLASLLDSDLPRGLALLARQLTALEQYAELRPNPSAIPKPQ